MTVKIELNSPYGWRLLIDGRPTPSDAHFKTAREAADRAAQVRGVAPLPALVASYLSTALWASTGVDGEPLDKKRGVSDFSERALATALEDGFDFATAAADDLLASGADPESIGHNFFLTRNRHGAGFWDDGRFPAPLGARLTTAAHSAGSCDVIETADGKLELS